MHWSVDCGESVSHLCSTPRSRETNLYCLNKLSGCPGHFYSVLYISLASALGIAMKNSSSRFNTEL